MTAALLAVTFVLSALLLGTTFAHVLEMRPKAYMGAHLWTTVQHRLYRDFATVGGAVEIGTIAAAAALTLSLRGGQGFWLAITATILFAAAFLGVWLGVVAPVNHETARWTSSAVPPDWQVWRRRWDLGHGVRFGLHLLGFFCLVGLALSSRP